MAAAAGCVALQRQSAAEGLWWLAVARQLLQLSRHLIATDPYPLHALFSLLQQQTVPIPWKVREAPQQQPQEETETAVPTGAAPAEIEVSRHPERQKVSSPPLYMNSAVSSRVSSIFVSPDAAVVSPAADGSSR